MAKISSDVISVYKITMELELSEVKELLDDLQYVRKATKGGVTTLILVGALETFLDEEDD